MAVLPFPDSSAPLPAEAGSIRDTNVLVAANLRLIRGARGLTQDEVAERLAELTGKRLSRASISQMEVSCSGGVRRRFDAHLLYLLAHVLDVPVIYFFLPLPQDGDAEERIRRLFGTSDEVSFVDVRLSEVSRARADSSPFPTSTANGQ